MTNGERFESEGETAPGIPLDVPDPDTIRQAYRSLREPSKPAQTDEDGSTSAADAPSAPDDAVDLAAWARGDEDYSFDEVDKAIRDWALKKVSDFADRVASIEEPRDAVRFLIEEGFIDGDDARIDV